MNVLQRLRMSDKVVSMADTGKTHAISLRVSEEDFNTLQQAAKITRRKVSDLCRYLAVRESEGIIRQETAKASEGTQPNAA